MKIVLLSCVVLVLAGTASAATVEASWDPVTLDVEGRPEDISHYVLYWGLSPRPAGVTHPSDGVFTYDSNVNVGNVDLVRQGDLLGGRTYYFSVAAVDVGGNVSAYAAEVSVDLPPEDDGGPVDGGTADAGTGTDAGRQTGDLGQDEIVVEGSCGCGAGTGGAVWLAGLMLMVFFRTGRRSELS